MQRYVYYDADRVENKVAQSQVEHDRERLHVRRVSDELLAELHVTTQVGEHANRLDLNLFILCC